MLQTIALPPGFGTPVGLRFICSGATATGSTVATARGSEGWWNATNSWVQGWRAADNPISVTNTDGYASTASGRVGAIVHVGTSTVVDYFTVNSVDDDEVVIQWNGGSSAPTAAWRGIVVAYGGSSCKVRVGVLNVASSDTVDVEKVVTFESGSTVHPQILRFVATRAAITTGDNFQTQATVGAGWAVSNQAGTPTIQQFAHGFAWEDGVTRPYAGASMENSERSGGADRCMVFGVAAATPSGTGILELELTDTNVGSFGVTPRSSIEGSDVNVGWAAIDFGGACRAMIGYYEQVGSTDPGYDSTPNITTPGWQPQFVEWVATDRANNGYQSGNLSGPVEWCGIIDEFTRVGARQGWLHENRATGGSTFTDTWSFYSEKLIEVRLHDDASLRWDATASLTALGIDLAIGTIPTSTTKINSYLAIEHAPIRPEPLQIPIVVTATTVTPTTKVVSPDPLELPIVVAPPNLAPGNVVVSPSPLEVAILVAGPSLGMGALAVAPAAIEIPILIAPPDLTRGTVIAAPAPIQVPILVAPPNLAMGGAVVAPDPLQVPILVVGPSVGGGTLAISPAPLTIPILVAGPSLGMGTLAVQPAPLQIVIVVPAVNLGTGIFIQPAPLVIPILVAGPSLNLGTKTVAPSPLQIPILTAPPSLNPGPIFLAPEPLAVPIIVQGPTLELLLPISPAPLLIPILVAPPSLGMGQATIAPDPLQVVIVVTTTNLVLPSLIVKTFLRGILYLPTLRLRSLAFEVERERPLWTPVHRERTLGVD